MRLNALAALITAEKGTQSKSIEIESASTRKSAQNIEIGHISTDADGVMKI